MEYGVLSELETAALRAATTKKLIRVFPNWQEQELLHTTEGWRANPDHWGPGERHANVIVKSLWDRGLLEANFKDPRAFGRFEELILAEEPDDAVLIGDSEIGYLIVWANARGRGLITAIEAAPMNALVCKPREVCSATRGSPPTSGFVGLA